MSCSEDQTILCSSCTDVERLEMELDRLRVLSVALAWPWSEHLQGSTTS
jgi:hypothetical protein